jgi:hypothetical protein
MPTATKKPVTIEFILFDGANFEEVTNFTNGIALQHRDNTSVMIIPTLEGEMTAATGDYIIKGVKGEFYPCKPDIFLATYDIN